MTTGRINQVTITKPPIKHVQADESDETALKTEPVLTPFGVFLCPYEFISS